MASREGEENPRVAVEVLLGHGQCVIFSETTHRINESDVQGAVKRIAGIEPFGTRFFQVAQDKHLQRNQEKGLRCGDNGIFVGLPPEEEEDHLLRIVQGLYSCWPSDGKAIYDLKNNEAIICWSNVPAVVVQARARQDAPGVNLKVNPLGDWTGGISVDCGATNRKLGSDMGRAATGGGLHGKDLSKADVSVNIWCWKRAWESNKIVEAYCAIGDERVRWRLGGEARESVAFADIVDEARSYIEEVGGFERFAMWGLI